MARRLPGLPEIHDPGSLNAQFTVTDSSNGDGNGYSDGS